MYLLRQELGDILTVPAHIDSGETTCKVVEVRAGCIVMSGKDGKLLVLPWQSREGRELPDAIQLKRTEKALEMKEIKRKVVADDCFLLSSCSVTGTMEEFTASFLSLKPQSQSDITTTEGKKEEIGAELGLSLVSIKESQAIREFKRDFPEYEKLALSDIVGLEESVERQLREIAGKWIYCGEGKIGGLLGLSVD